jgi:glycerophosphoryl diester phosphodiesterase
LLIAHRGASMLSPENTIAAANLANSLGVYGIETDVLVSQDGEMFLMHDDTLDRTTDVAARFPGRQDEPAANFTWAELSQLNAGQWFVEQDPYGAIKKGLVSPEQVAEYRQQTVPLLTDWLDIVKANGLAFIFDLKQLPAAHPYAGSFFEMAFEQIHSAGVDPQIWFLVSPEQLAFVRTQAPGMLPAYGADYQDLPSPSELLSQGYALVNVEYGISPGMIRQYQEAGLWVNVYTVDEPWQFSRLWLLGVDSVTTSNAGVMAELSRPVFSLAYNLYLVAWVLVGLAALGLLLGMVLPVVKERG